VKSHPENNQQISIDRVVLLGRSGGLGGDA